MHGRINSTMVSLAASLSCGVAGFFLEYPYIKRRVCHLEELCDEESPLVSCLRYFVISALVTANHPPLMPTSSLILCLLVNPTGENDEDRPSTELISQCL